MPVLASGRLRGPLRPVFASWLGWLAPSDRLIVIRDTEQDRAEIVWQAAKIGYDNLAGNSPAASTPGRALDTRSRVPGWCDPIRSTASGPRHPADTRIRRRPPPGAVHIELGDIADGANDLRREPTVVMCDHGERANRRRQPARTCRS
ncbi:MAG: putative hydrolase [Mycobacterium sp.]|jgi:hydroxyacylglutathione hydrolase|nr:putative hydrolase [Mycobacterium sp.]